MYWWAVTEKPDIDQMSSGNLNNYEPYLCYINKTLHNNRRLI